MCPIFISLTLLFLIFNFQGKLTKDDIRKSFKEFIGTELSEDDLYTMFRQVNYSRSGDIEYSEFVVASLFEKKMIDDAKLEAAFSHFDKANKGHITLDDIKVVLELGDDMDEYVSKKIIREVDENGDGVICFDEFRDMMFSSAVIPPPPRRSSSKESDEDAAPARRGLRRQGVSGSICSLSMALSDDDTTEELTTPSFYDGASSTRSVFTTLTDKVAEHQSHDGDDDNAGKKKPTKKKSLSRIFQKK